MNWSSRFFVPDWMVTGPAYFIRTSPEVVMSNLCPADGNSAVLLLLLSEHLNSSIANHHHASPIPPAAEHAACCFLLHTGELCSIFQWPRHPDLLIACYATETRLRSPTLPDSRTASCASVDSRYLLQEQWNSRVFITRGLRLRLDTIPDPFD